MNSNTSNEIKIAIIDDHELIRECLFNCLSLWGYRVVKSWQKLWAVYAIGFFCLSGLLDKSNWYLEDLMEIQQLKYLININKAQLHSQKR